MDGQVGELLQALHDAGQSNDTIVLFTSEQGSQFPGCKWTNWDTGIHTALIARWPGKIVAGQRTDAIVQYADVAPTLIDAAGGKPENWTFDGSSFLSVMRGQTKRHREYAYGIHNNLPEGPAYPIRTVTDGRYRYIRNLLPDELYIEKHLMGQRGNGSLNNPYWGTWIFETYNRPQTYRLVKRYMQRPHEQLYLTTHDPYEMKNLAEDPPHMQRRSNGSVPSSIAGCSRRAIPVFRRTHNQHSKRRGAAGICTGRRRIDGTDSDHPGRPAAPSRVKASGDRAGCHQADTRCL